MRMKRSPANKITISKSGAVGAAKKNERPPLLAPAPTSTAKAAVLHCVRLSFAASGEILVRRRTRFRGHDQPEW
jgi:hypothetical protein